jgi:hypothetical protein
MRPSQEIENLVQKADCQAPDAMRQRLWENVAQELHPSRSATPRRGEMRVWRILMNSKIARLAFAAVIVVAVLIGMSQLEGSATSVVWGEVVRNIEANPGFVFRMKQIHNNEKTGIREFHMVVYGSAEYGMRMDGYLDPKDPIQTYGSLKEEAMISIMHSSKTYTRMPLSGDQLAEFEELDLKKRVREYISAKHRKLGRKIIEGIEAEGIEIDDPSEAKANFQVDSCAIQLWVAVDTGLPILVEVDTVGKNGTLEIHTVQDNFRWVELDASEFEPNIPEDYTLMEVEIDADGGAPFKTTMKYDSQDVVGTKIHKWRFIGKDPERGYLLRSEDGQTTTSIPESWADSPEHAVRVKEEMDLQRQQGTRQLAAVTETEVNGQLDSRFVMYEHTLSDGRVIRDGDFDPDLTNPRILVGERREELSRLLHERRRQEEKGQELVTTEERQVDGRVFTFRKRRFLLTDGTEVIHSIGRLKGD